MRASIILLLFVSLLFAAGCKKDQKQPVASPVEATLVFPEQNSLCTAGAILSETQSTIDFKWNAGTNTDHYVLTLKNLLTGATTTQSSSTAELAVTLARNTPYSWYITSTYSKSTASAQSDTWRFYNSGPGIVSHVPFPAELLTPALAATVTPVGGKITLSWQGSDVDNDITGYDVYIDTVATPTLYKSEITTTSLSNVPVTSGYTYYWMIVTKDSQGNSSNSAIYQFKVN